MQVLTVFVVTEHMLNLGARQHIQCARLQIDHRRGGDPDLRPNEGALNVGRGNSGDVMLLVEKTHMPQGWFTRSLGVKRIHAVVFRGNKEHVVLPFVWNLDRWDE